MSDEDTEEEPDVEKSPPGRYLREGIEAAECSDTAGIEDIIKHIKEIEEDE